MRIAAAAATCDEIATATSPPRHHGRPLRPSRPAMNHGCFPRWCSRSLVCCPAAIVLCLN